MKKINFNRFISLLVLAGTAIGTQPALSQVPSIHYPSAQVYSAGATITPLTPTNTGGVVAAYVSTFATGFSHPASMAIDASNNIYLCDQFNNQIKKITSTGSVSVFAGNGSGSAGYVDGIGTGASFNSPAGIAIDNSAGYLYVTDGGNSLIRRIAIATQQVTTFAGNGIQGYTDSTNPLLASFYGPLGAAVDGSGNVYVAEYYGQRIRKITPAGVVSTLAGSSYEGTADGTGTGASFDYPCNLRVDGSGNVYVVDRSSDLIRKITPSGVVTTIAGIPYAETSVDGTVPSAKFFRPSDLTFDASGNLYVTDYLGNVIRKMNTSGTVAVSTFAGSGAGGATDGAVATASFNGPFGIVMDGSSNLFVSDIVNNSIRKITTDGFSITPALPPGLVFDSKTGTISGTPTAGAPLTTYTITATNSSGPNSTTLDITIYGNSAINPSANQNFIITYTPRTEIADITQFAGRPVADVNQTIQYLDGLGRPMQTVQWQGSPNHSDIVQPTAYDQYGREAIKYLPYANSPAIGSDGGYKSDAITTQEPAFYASGSWDPNIVHTPYPITGTTFEASQLNRAVEQGAPGQSWQLSTSGVSNSGHTIRIAYGINDNTTATTTISNWQVNNTGTGAAINGNYLANTLYSTTTIDENGNNTIEFKDMQGKIVCKKVPDPNNNGAYLSTCYIYDDYDNLAYVIPPIPATITYPTSFTESNTDPVFNGYIYAYHYDARNRLTEKKIPGKGWDFTIYNTLDQVTFTQDANQRAKNAQEWTFIQYDGFGRVALTGIWNSNGAPGSTGDTNVSSPDHTLQQWLTNWQNGQTSLWLTRDNTTATGYSVANPQGGQLLTINYYDNYNFSGNPYSSWVGYEPAPTGLLTGSRTVVLNPDGTYGPMLWSVSYYDDKGRIVQTFNQHYLGGSYNTGNYNTTQNTYNFDNSVATSTTWSFNGGAQAVAFGNQYYYDHAGRKTQTWLSMDLGSNGWQPGFLLNTEEYNEIGQLKTKHLQGNSLGGPFLQDMNYTYNERGWLSTALSQANGAPSNLFDLALKYDVPDAGYTPQWNGNISEFHYYGQNSGNKKIGYTYDALNRLTNAASTGGTLDETINYDQMGNITQLTRAGYGTLNYSTYTGNQLNSITGYSPRTYAYDPNGNATSDGQSKGIEYNMLNLPRRVSSGSSQLATYIYDATGNKLQNANASDTWDYLGGIVYHNNALAFVQTEEGRAVPNGSGFNYKYDLKDHLGNVRVTIDQNVSTGQAEVVQEDEYYSFGLRHGLYDNSNGNRYLYNGKEIQNVLTDQYDYGARFYDPMIARWTSVDPLAVLTQSLSPYRYGYNNPVRFVDPNGMSERDDQREFFQNLSPEELKKLRDQDPVGKIPGYRDWYTNGEGKATWDPNVHGTKDAEEKGGTYIGETFIATDRYGNTRFGDKNGQVWSTVMIGEVTVKDWNDSDDSYKDKITTGLNTGLGSVYTGAKWLKKSGRFLENDAALLEKASPIGYAVSAYGVFRDFQQWKHNRSLGNSIRLGWDTVVGVAGIFAPEVGAADGIFDSSGFKSKLINGIDKWNTDRNDQYAIDVFKVN